MSGGDRTKLPKWAQREMEVLDRHVRDAKKATHDAYVLAGIQPAENKRSLIVPTKKDIYFSADAEGISVSYSHGVLRVRSGWGAGLAVKPVVSNVIEVISL